MTRAAIKRAADQIRPSSFVDYRQYLEGLYQAIKTESGQYSYLTFASDLGFSATNILNQIVHGRRPLTEKAAQKIAAAIDLRGLERRYLLGLVALNGSKTPGEHEAALDQLMELKSRQAPASVERDMLEYYGCWYHSIVREMVRMDDFRSDPAWIAPRIRPQVRPAQVAESLAMLERLKLIRFDKRRKRHVPVVETISTGHEVEGMAIMNYHAKMIENGALALTRVPPEQRDVSVVTMCLSERSARKIKTLIHAFQMALLEEDRQCSERDRVVQVNIQMFPFTTDTP